LVNMLYYWLFALILIVIVTIMVMHFEKQKKERFRKITILQQISPLISESSLSMLFNIHKILGRNNLCNNPYLAPNKYGVFRTNCIAIMDESEVFLGNIQGLWTFSLPYWESCKDEDAKEIVTSQYRQLLQQGIEYELSKLKK